MAVKSQHDVAEAALALMERTRKLAAVNAGAGRGADRAGRLLGAIAVSFA